MRLTRSILADRKGLAAAVVAVVALGATAGMTLGGFSATVDNPTNTFSSGTIQLEEGVAASDCFSTGTGSGGTVSAANTGTCAGDDLGENLRGKRFALGYACDHGLDIGAGQTCKSGRGDMPVIRPRRCKLGAGGRDHEERQVGSLLDESRQELERGGVDPVPVLEDKEDRPCRAESPELIEKRIEHAFF